MKKKIKKAALSTKLRASKKKVVKKAVKKPAKKAAKKAVKTAPKRKPIGEVTHFYDKICVAVVKFNQGVAVGEEVCFEGPKNAFSQALESMQLEHQPVQKAKKGQEVGVKVKKAVKEGYKIYKA